MIGNEQLAMSNERLDSECVREADAPGGLVVVSMKVRSGWKPLY